MCPNNYSIGNQRRDASMKGDKIPGSVKKLLGRTGKKVKTWGDFNRLMQPQIRQSKHGRRFPTTQRVALKILDKLRVEYLSKEKAKKTDKQ